MTEELNLPVKSMNDLSIIGQQFAQSGMFGIKNEAAGLIVAMTCYMEKITPLKFIRTYHIIDGKPSMKADAIAAEFRLRGGKYKVINRDNDKAEAEFTFEGNKVKMSFTMEEAKSQGICFTSDGKTLKENWRKFPANMLWARMMSNSVRVLCPEINSGVYTPEEISDMHEEHIEKPLTEEAFKNITKEVIIEEPRQTPEETETTIPVQSVTDSEQDLKPVGVEVIEPEKEKPKSKSKEKTPWDVIKEQEAVNYEICPIGKVKGTAWAEMPNDHLESALVVPSLETQYKEVITRILAIRKEKGIKVL
jgi:hypothetical protein